MREFPVNLPQPQISGTDSNRVNFWSEFPVNETPVENSGQDSPETYEDCLSEASSKPVGERLAVIEAALRGAAMDFNRIDETVGHLLNFCQELYKEFEALKREVRDDGQW